MSQLTDSPQQPLVQVRGVPAVEPAGWLAWVIRTLAGARWPWLAGLTAFVLSVPAWNGGFQMDDFYHQAVLRGELQLGNGSPIFDVFTWSLGGAAQNRAGAESGLMPWWTSTHYKMNFYRPLAAATHWIDQRVWPSQKWLMHLQSSLWFAGASIAVGFLFRRIFQHHGDGAIFIRSPRFSPPSRRLMFGPHDRENKLADRLRQPALWGGAATAGLANLIYALRDEHATTVAWIANRNLLLMTLFGSLAWLCHLAWRERGDTRAAVAAPLFFAVALCSGESAVAIGGCLFAHAVVLERGSWRSRFVSLLPCGLVGIAWLAMYGALGCGAAESGIYLDPKHNMGAFALGFIQRAPVYLASSFGLMSVHGHTFTSPFRQHVIEFLSVVTITGIAVVIWPAARRDRLLKFFALCLAMAIVPLCAGLASDRLMMIFNIPATGLIARFIQLVLNRAPALPAGPNWQRGARWLTTIFLGIHLVIAPCLMVVGVLAFKAYGDALLTSARSPALNHAGFNKQDLILLNAPHGMYTLYMNFARLDEGLPRARSTLMLAGAMSPFDVARPDERTLVVTIPEGLLKDVFSRIYRNPAQQPLVAGTKLEFSRWTITILEAEAGQPTRVMYRFDVPLEDRSLCLVEWCKDEYVPFVPPPVGQTRAIPRACTWTIYHVDPFRKVLGM